MRLFFQFFSKWIPIFSLLKRLIFKFYVNGFPCIFFAHELFFLSSLQIDTCVFFLKFFVSKLHKINLSLKFHQEFFFRTNPLPTNPIDSNQLSLKLWFEINHALEVSWKYFNNHVWWCCVKLYLRVLLILIMVDCLQGIMKMGILIVWRWWVMLTCYRGPWIIHHPQICMWYWLYRMVHSRMWYISYIIKSMTSWWLTFFLHIFFLVCFQRNHNNNNNSSNVLQQ